MSQVLNIRNENNNNVWRPPKGDIIKINFDAAFNQIQHKSVLGIIARNKDGYVMASCTYSGENIIDPTTAEARACLKEVTMVKEMGC